ncbi:dermonecrotic toxin domain-containing protein [Pandoraea anhela]|uniref:Toxin Afp18 n=1 Tax=Pandoraea anhela TaxID=2508295 RepID=A0A5E4V2N0_9BURK|nr:DUF6543 domain-containing protein [Pandoraea anhela]VVE06063.1 Toxin Afp18 [Pandoraea anhela]
MFLNAADISPASVHLPCRHNECDGATHDLAFLDVTRFDRLASGAQAIVDAPPEAQPALGLMLRLIEAHVTPHDLAALNDTIIERFAATFDDAPQVATCLVNMLPDALAQRAPSESVEDICRRLLSKRALRDLKRSLSREAAPTVESARYGSAWHRYFSEWRDWVVDKWQNFLLLGSKERSHDPWFTLMRGAEPTRTAGPLPRRRSGKTGCALGMLYATSFVQYRTEPLPAQGFAQGFSPSLAHGGTIGLPGQTIAPATSVTSETMLLDRLVQTFADAARYVADVATPVSEQVDSALAVISPFMSLAPPGADGASTPLPVVIKRTGVSPAPAPPDMQASPELQSLFDIAHLWRHRGATHQELRKSFLPLLTFSPPPSERELLDGLFENAPELANADLSELRLRRHTPNKDGGRLKRVSYWPLHDAAALVRSGKLNISDTDDGVRFDVSRKTLAGAVYEAACVMSAKRFDDIVGQWREACEQRTAATWLSPPGLVSRAKSSLTLAIGTAFALDELSLGYTHALIGNKAFYLGHNALTNLSLSNDASSRLFATHRLEFTIRHAGRDHVAAPAGSCVVTEASGNGTTLLYLQGDVAAWRAFASPEALLSDIGHNALSLRTTLCERLPLPLRTGALTGRITTKLHPQPGQEPVRIATQATLDTVYADGKLRTSHAGTGPRIAQYLTWLTGVSSESVERGLQTFRERSRSAGVSLPGKPANIALRDIRSVAHVEMLRYDISTAIPRVKPMVRQHISNRLTDLGVLPADGDQVYIRVAGRVVQSLTDAVLVGTIPSDAAKRLPLLIPEVGGKYTAVHGANQPTGQPVSVGDVFDEASIEALRQNIDRAATQFWETSRGKVRKVLKSEFIAQVWMSRVQRRMSVDQVHIAARIAGPIEVGRLGSDDLEHEINAPDVEREWLRVNGLTSRLMRVSIAGRAPCLLIAPYPEGLRIYGFDDRGRMTTWLTEQIHSEAMRERIASMFDAPPDNATWYRTASIDTQGVSDNIVTDTFTAIASAYESRQNHTAPPVAKSEPRLVLELMDKFSKVDLALGLGTWALPFARPISLGYSIVDASIGTVGMGVGLATQDSAMFRQGWESTLSAIGAQGLAATHFKTMLFLTGDARYKYFVAEAPRAEDALILGLHRSQGRFYAAIDADTRAYLILDNDTGFFRMVPEAASDTVKKDAPLLRRSASGSWRAVTQSEFATPELEDPDTAWRIDQGFRARFDELRDKHDPIFERARLAASSEETPGNAIPLEWRLRLLKLDFVDQSVMDVEALGKLAGRIDSLQNTLDAAEKFVISPLSDEATRLGAMYQPITQRPRVYLGHVRTGLLRACPLVNRNLPIETAVRIFNQQATWAPSASARLMQDLSELGRVKLQYLPNQRLSQEVETLDTLFSGAPNTARAFEMTAGTRLLLVGRHLRNGAAAQYYFIDPALGLVTHADSETLIGILRTHLNIMSDSYALVREGRTYTVRTKEIDLPHLARVDLLRDFNDVVPIRVALRL